MLSSVTHDRGPGNHVLPLFEHAQAQGLPVRFIDPAAPQHAELRSVFQEHSVGQFGTGWSVNQAEWPWVLAAREVPACRVSVNGSPCRKRLIESKPAAMETASLNDINGCHKNLPFVSVFLPNYGAPAASAKAVRRTRSKVLAENYPGPRRRRGPRLRSSFVIRNEVNNFYAT